jgi:lauroyl/myristoyl acyltransferase
VLVLCDDAVDHVSRRHEVAFLDARAQLPSGVVTLARLAGAPIVSFYVLPRAPRRWVVIADAPVQPPPRRSGAAGEQAVLQRLADNWSAMIRAHPAHWAAVFPIDWLPTA